MVSKVDLGLELERVYRLADSLCSIGQVEVLAKIPYKGLEFPVLGISLGAKDRTLPTFGLFSGVHGLERIGSHLSLYYLESLVSQWSWNRELRDRMERGRLVSIPIINPTGMFGGTRSNYQGVDLMRNSPIEADEKALFLVGGHRISKRLPWYRGKVNEPMQLESRVLVDFVKREMFESQISFALDLHSGFGMVDRLWYPFAKTRNDFPLLGFAKKFENLLTNSYPHHVYKIESQSQSYVTHGDLWDYMFEEQQAGANKNNIFVPWALEMGSWVWLRKNPRQLFSVLGHFNPVKPHRYRRILRRHYFLIDFYFKSLTNWDLWIN